MPPDGVWANVLAALEADAEALEHVRHDLDALATFVQRDPVALPTSMPPLPAELALRAQALAARLARLEADVEARLAATGRELAAMARLGAAGVSAEPRRVDISA